jgi:hypothetical protein
MVDITVTTKEGVSVTVDYPVSEDLQDNRDRFGDEVCAEALRAALVLRVQSRIRALINAEKTEDEIQADLKTWKIGVATRRGIPLKDKVKAQMEKMSPEERANLLKELQAQLKQQKQAA